MPHRKNFWQTCASAMLCAVLASTAHADTSRQEFNAAKQKWLAAGIHDYSFTLFRSCFCPGGQALGITVQGDNVLHVTPGQSGEVGESLAITDIFQQIDAAYAKPADHITLTLNPEYGYPERVYIDYVAMMADEELSYTISDFSH